MVWSKGGLVKAVHRCPRSPSTAFTSPQNSRTFLRPYPYPASQIFSLPSLLLSSPSQSSNEDGRIPGCASRHGRSCVAGGRVSHSSPSRVAGKETHRQGWRKTWWRLSSSSCWWRLRRWISGQSDDEAAAKSSGRMHETHQRLMRWEPAPAAKATRNCAGGLGHEEPCGGGTAGRRWHRLPSPRVSFPCPNLFNSPLTACFLLVTAATSPRS
jgi:hypothetical protein